MLLVTLGDRCSCYRSLKFNKDSSFTLVGITSIAFVMNSGFSSSNFSSITFVLIFWSLFFSFAVLCGLKSTLSLSNLLLYYLLYSIVSLLDFIVLLCKMSVDPYTSIMGLFFINLTSEGKIDNSEGCNKCVFQ